MFILIIVFLLVAAIFYFFNEFIVSFVSPIWKTENKITKSLSRNINFFRLKKSLIAENILLKEKLDFMEADALALSAERIQRNTLLELIGRKENFHKIVATVLTRPSQTPYDIIMIDAGFSESITVGSEVSLPEGPMLGTVSEVFSKSAKVKLFSTDGENTNAVLERNNMPVILFGLGGGNFKLFVPRDIVIEVGDKILSSGIVPHHLATVGGISVRPTDSFKEVLAKSPANIFTLRFVFIAP